MASVAEILGAVAPVSGGAASVGTWGVGAWRTTILPWTYGSTRTRRTISDGGDVSEAPSTRNRNRVIGG